MAAAWAQARIADLEFRLAQKTTDLAVKTAESEVKTTELALTNNQINELQTTLDRRTALGVELATRIRDLEAKLTTKQTELEQVYTQLYRLQTSEIARLTASSNWASAATILKAQVIIKENDLAIVNATGDRARIDLLSRALCDQHYQLGKLYLKASDLSEAEIYTRKAHDKRLRLLGQESSDTRLAQQQLCKILRRTGNETKIRRAIALYRDYWERQTDDEFVLECGHELGRLYQEQGRPGEALPLFRAVWEKRRAHANPAERALSMSTVEHLLSIETPIQKGVVLETLWADHRGAPLAGTAMLKHADTLASLYWKEKDYARAEPVLEALWAARRGDIRIPADMSRAEKKARLGAWFVTGYRYGNTLTKVGSGAAATSQLRDELYPRANSIFQQLWTVRENLPRSVEADVTIFLLADYYAGMLLYLNNPKLAEEVAGAAWQIATPPNSTQVLTIDMLYVGDRYAEALNVDANGKSEKATDIYKILFAAWEELSQDQPQNRDLALATISCGHSLLAVLRARGKAPGKCEKLNLKLKKLERALRQAPASQQRQIGWRT